MAWATCAWTPWCRWRLFPLPAMWRDAGAFSTGSPHRHPIPRPGNLEATTTSWCVCHAAWALRPKPFPPRDLDLGPLEARAKRWQASITAPRTLADYTPHQRWRGFNPSQAKTHRPRDPCTATCSADILRATLTVVALSARTRTSTPALQAQASVPSEARPHDYLCSCVPVQLQ